MIVYMKYLEEAHTKMKTYRLELLLQAEQIREIRVRIQDIPHQEEIIQELLGIEEDIKEECEQAFYFMTAIKKITTILKKTEMKNIDAYEINQFVKKSFKNIQWVTINQQSVDLHGAVFQQ